MITKQECLSILVDMEDKDGIDINKYMKMLLVSKEVPNEVLKFIYSHHGFAVAEFYESLRKKHNEHNSPLYTNIIRGIDDVSNMIVTLSSLLTQIALFNKSHSDKSFINEVRAKDIAAVLSNYYIDGDNNPVIKIMSLIRADILVLEYVAGRRELE